VLCKTRIIEEVSLVMWSPHLFFRLIYYVMSWKKNDAMELFDRLLTTNMPSINRNQFTACWDGTGTMGH